MVAPLPIRSFLVAFIVLVSAASPLAAAPAPVTTLPSRLSLDEALKIFRTHGLDLLLADAVVLNARGDRAVAGAVPNPLLNLGAGSALANVAGCDGCLAWNVGLSDQNALFDTISGKRGLRIRVAEAAMKAARMSRADAQRTLEFQVKQQYIQAVLAHDQLDFAIEVLKSSTQTLELNLVRYKAGAISEADVAKVEAAKLEADQAVATARQALRVAKIGLALVLGVRGSVPAFEVQPDLPAYAVPAKVASMTPETLLREALDHRPDLHAQGHQVERAQWAVQAAKRMLVPDIALSANFYGQGSGQNAVQPPTLTFGVQLPLPLFNHYKGERLKAQADLDTQTAQRAKTEAQVLADVQTAYENIVASRELVERMEGRLLDRARRARDLIAVQYQKGAASLLEFLDAQRTYNATNQEYLQDLANYWTSLFLLEEAVGVELRS
jgi:cobalt-zinc-cadmium efflux system outer membrane protein